MVIAILKRLVQHQSATQSYQQNLKQKKITFLLTAYLRYKTIIPQNVLSEAQLYNLFIS